MANTEMKNPKNGDVRVVPDELVDRYRERGWTKRTAASSKPAAKKTAASKKTAAAPATK